MIKLHESWLGPLREEFDAPYMLALRQFLAAEREAGKLIYPKPNNWFAALDLTPLEKTRVVGARRAELKSKVRGPAPRHGMGPVRG